MCGLWGLGTGSLVCPAQVLLLQDQERPRPLAAAEWQRLLQTHKGVKERLWIILTLNCLRPVEA